MLLGRRRAGKGQRLQGEYLRGSAQRPSIVVIISHRQALAMEAKRGPRDATESARECENRDR